MVCIVCPAWAWSLGRVVVVCAVTCKIRVAQGR